MTKPPRYKDVFGFTIKRELAPETGPDEASAPPTDARRSRRHKAIAARDARPVVRGESYPIAGEPIAMDERPKPSLAPVTFDGATPSLTRKEIR